MIADPPVDPGAVHVSVRDVPLPEADRLVGAPGMVAGILVAVVVYGPVPTEFSAATRKSYEVPFVRPGIKA